MDSDDYVDKEYIQNMYEKIQKTIQIFAWQDTGLKAWFRSKMKMEKVVVYTIKVYIMKNYWILYWEKWNVFPSCKVV